MFKNLVILLLGFIVLYLTNPTEEKFVKYYEERIEKMQKKEGWKEDVLTAAKKVNLRMNVKRGDKIIYSIYTVNFFGEEEKYLGIATRFFDITKAEEKVEEIKEKAAE